MSTDLRDIAQRVANYNGGKYHDRRSHAKRAHRTEISYQGVPLVVEYFLDGEFMSATDTDAAEFPCCLVQAVEAGGVDITAIVDTDAIAERIEQGWRE